MTFSFAVLQVGGKMAMAASHFQATFYAMNKDSEG